MSYSAESFTKKLSVLQDTQDSIVSISQWVLFHHRHAPETALIWKKVILQEKSGSKKLSLFYLCNDVVQQAKRKRKTEFLVEFAKILPDTFSKVYLTLDSNVKSKVDRLIKLWEERDIFNSRQISDFRSAIKLSITTENATIARANLMTSQVKALNELFVRFNSLAETTGGNYTQFNIQSNNYLGDNQDNLPSPKIYMTKLNVLQKLGNISRDNLKNLLEIKQKIKGELTQLLELTDDSDEQTKIAKIDTTLTKLVETRNELKAMIPDYEQKPREPESTSASTTTNSSSQSTTVEDDDDDDMVPTYEDSDDDKDDEVAVEDTTEDVTPSQPSLKRRASNTTSGGSTPKKVAFSEDIEVKEFETEDDMQGPQDDEPEATDDFAIHHKDTLRLKHEQEERLHTPAIDFSNDSLDNGQDEYNVTNSGGGDDDDDNDDGYDPEEGVEKQAENGSSDVMSLLMKLT